MSLVGAFSNSAGFICFSSVRVARLRSLHVIMWATSFVATCSAAYGSNTHCLPSHLADYRGLPRGWRARGCVASTIASGAAHNAIASGVAHSASASCATQRGMVTFYMEETCGPFSRERVVSAK